MLSRCLHDLLCHLPCPLVEDRHYVWLCTLPNTWMHFFFHCFSFCFYCIWKCKCLSPKTFQFILIILTYYTQSHRTLMVCNGIHKYLKSVLFIVLC